MGGASSLRFVGEGVSALDQIESLLSNDQRLKLPAG
jgi:hypothetical protein